MISAMTDPGNGRRPGESRGGSLAGTARDLRLGAARVRLSSLIAHHPYEVPEPALDHLIRLTDDTGLFQHAKFTVPNRAHGYCTDDNARGAIAMVKYYALCGDARTRGCSDGLMSGGVNGNQGAESMVSFLLSLLSILEGHAL